MIVVLALIGVAIYSQYYHQLTGEEWQRFVMAQDKARATCDKDTELVLLKAKEKIATYYFMPGTCAVSYDASRNIMSDAFTDPLGGAGYASIPVSDWKIGESEALKIAFKEGGQEYLDAGGTRLADLMLRYDSKSGVIWIADFFKEYTQGGMTVLSEQLFIVINASTGKVIDKHTFTPYH